MFERTCAELIPVASHERHDVSNQRQLDYCGKRFHVMTSPCWLALFLLQRFFQLADQDAKDQVSFDDYIRVMGDAPLKVHRYVFNRLDWRWRIIQRIEAWNNSGH